MARADVNDDGARGRHTAALQWTVYAVVATTAFTVRLTPVLLGAGFASSGRYDDSVYFAAADALTFGRVPYRDFVLLHPPGIALVLAPFALLGRLTSDRTGMMAGQLAFMAVGALNAVLVAVIARRWGRLCSALAGGLYACWQPAVYAEQATLLEPLGTTAILASLLLLFDADRSARWRHLAAGALLGASLTLKIWYVAPFLVIVIWATCVHGRAALMRLVGAGLAVAGVVLVPFFALAPRRMFDMVLRDQFARPAGHASRLPRLTTILGAQTFVEAHAAIVHVLTLALGVAVIAAAVTCLTLGHRAVALVAVMGTTVTVLLAGPAYFGHYAELAAAPTVLVLTVGLTQLARMAAPGTSGRFAVAGVAVVLLGYAGAHVADIPAGRSVAWPKLAAAAPVGCVASDSPEPLIGMDRLSADLAHGCALPVDVGGLGYDLLAPRHGKLVYVSRSRNPVWQRFLYRYLTGARSFVLLRGRGEIMPAFYDRLAAHPVLATVGNVALRAGGPINR